jgi:hypothetical protein
LEQACAPAFPDHVRAPLSIRRTKPTRGPRSALIPWSHNLSPDICLLGFGYLAKVNYLLKRFKSSSLTPAAVPESPFSTATRTRIYPLIALKNPAKETPLAPAPLH